MLQLRRAVGPPPFEVEVSDQGTTRIVGLRGELDLDTVRSVCEPVYEALRDGVETLVVDFTETTFVDSTGIHMIIETDAHARRGGVRFVVLPGPPAVERAFELAGFASLSNVRPTAA